MDLGENLTLKRNSSGIPLGLEAKAPLFLDQAQGLVFVDQTDGTYWQMVVISGELTVRQITI